MTRRRMFSLDIVDTDNFLDLPVSSQALYFQLGMRADDDGFVGNPKKIAKVCGASQNDLELLEKKDFIHTFDSGVVVILAWKMNNYLQNDRYKETIYKEEKLQLHLDTNDNYVSNAKMDISDIALIKDSGKSRQKRIEEYKNSDLPYSFMYKMRRAFNNKECPICHKIMKCNNEYCKPTIQHNIPISMGGKHEIDNISVICNRCNCSIQDKKITSNLNNNIVKEIWDYIK